MHSMSLRQSHLIVVILGQRRDSPTANTAIVEQGRENRSTLSLLSWLATTALQREWLVSRYEYGRGQSLLSRPMANRQEQRLSTARRRRQTERQHFTDCPSYQATSLPGDQPAVTGLQQTCKDARVKRSTESHIHRTYKGAVPSTVPNAQYPVGEASAHFARFLDCSLFNAAKADRQLPDAILTDRPFVCELMKKE